MYRDLIKLSEVSPADAYRLSMSLIVPRPVSWVATFNEDGKANLAPYGFFCVASSEPMILQFGSRALKDSWHNAARTGAFTIHFASVEQQPLVKLTSQEFPSDISEAEEAGLTWKRGDVVNAPVLDDTHTAFECELFQQIRIGNGGITLGEVKAIHVNPEVIGENGLADISKLNPLSKLGGQEWGSTSVI